MPNKKICSYCLHEAFGTHFEILGVSEIKEYVDCDDNHIKTKIKIKFNRENKISDIGCPFFNCNFKLEHLVINEAEAR